MDLAPLIAYDAELCHYIVTQFTRNLVSSKRPAIPRPPEAKSQARTPRKDARKERTPPANYWTETLDYPTWLCLLVEKDDVLADLLWPDPRKNRSNEPLNDAQLDYFEAIAEWAPGHIQPILVWQAYPTVHDRAVNVTAVLRELLSKATAEHWSDLSEQCSRDLSQADLPVRKGIDIVRPWLERLRQCVRAIVRANPLDIVQSQRDQIEVMLDLSTARSANIFANKPRDLQTEKPDPALKYESEPVCESKEMSILKEAAKKARLKLNSETIVNEIIANNGRVAVADLAVKLGWNNPSDNWNSARKVLNEKMKSQGWRFITQGGFAVAEQISLSSRHSSLTGEK